MPVNDDVCWLIAQSLGIFAECKIKIATSSSQPATLIAGAYGIRTGMRSCTGLRFDRAASQGDGRAPRQCLSARPGIGVSFRAKARCFVGTAPHDPRRLSLPPTQIVVAAALIAPSDRLVGDPPLKNPGKRLRLHAHRSVGVHLSVERPIAPFSLNPAIDDCKR